MHNKKMDKALNEIRALAEAGISDGSGAREALEEILKVADRYQPLRPGWLKQSLDSAHERVMARPPELRPRHLRNVEPTNSSS